jgi:NADH:ubiquinone oxidoreductase subunit F (NADH-binding)
MPWLKQVPWLIVEGVILAARVVGARKAYIYVRHEYEEQIHALRMEIQRAEDQGVCGPGTSRTPRPIEVEVFVSPGGYICGEQSALIEALEDHRAEPRNRPPEITANGLFGKPTLLSNVETFAWVPGILLNGGPWYRSMGVHGYRGRRFFSVSGDVTFPGVYEVPVGTTIGEFLANYANREPREDPLKALAPSGPSGGFLPRRIPLTLLRCSKEPKSPSGRFLAEVVPPGRNYLDVLDLPMDLMLFRQLGLMLGAGLVVFGRDADMVEQAVKGGSSTAMNPVASVFPAATARSSWW